MKPILKNDSPIIKNRLTTSSRKTKRNFQKKYGILGQQIIKQKLAAKSYEDAPQ